MTNDLTSNAIEPPLPATHAGSLAQWGMDEVAYIKREILDGDTVFAIHAADGCGAEPRHRRRDYRAKRNGARRRALARVRAPRRLN